MSSEPENAQENNQKMKVQAVFDINAELAETQRDLRDTKLLIEQSQNEIEKLTQRNAAITSHLQQVNSQKEEMPIEEIRMAYDSALDAQQRLFVMRGQLDKLQSDKTHYERYKVALEFMQSGNSSSADGSPKAAAGNGGLASVEMLINAQESERQRLSRQMHDGPAQALSNFILQTEIAMRLFDIDLAQAKEELDNLKSSAMGTFQKVRNFIFELRPMMLDDLGLIPTINRYSDAFKEQTGLEVQITNSGNERRLESYLEVMIFRAIQELMGNAARHSQATTIKLNTQLSDELIRVTVDDNGRGFDTDTLDPAKYLGIKLIRERTEMLGGTFEIDSTVGKGTRVTFSMPAGSV
ncbi:MAG: sensor histidine kinase [Anaerolineae bacterium]|nr:sensor histidine kinase [Anaerolineae bacterium]MDK1080270.1 sensor histidine kinase [Anaerolineae bacterium]MDK1118344.1 sensor histidine kinase [Anaerolineae bacterium]